VQEFGDTPYGLAFFFDSISSAAINGDEDFDEFALDDVCNRINFVEEFNSSCEAIKNLVWADRPLTDATELTR
jgi:hypothetical protein